MKFSIFTTITEPEYQATPDEKLDMLREQVVLAEEMGFYGVWLGEHHFGPYGSGDVPNPIIVGADLAARTSRIKIGQMANIAVWWHPIRLAEDLAILDNLTKGRMEVGFGRGIWPYEGPQFHPNADPRKDKENRELFAEVIEVVKKVWTQEYFSHEGPNFKFPADDTEFSHPLYPSNPEWQDGAKVNKLRVTPKPYQKPHPPLWATVSTDRSVTMAAELGLNACYGQPPVRRVRQRCETYARVRSQVEGRPYALGEAQVLVRSAYIARTMEEARRVAGEGIVAPFAYNDPFRGLDIFLNPGEKQTPDMKLDWDFLEPRNLLVGPPDHVIERIEETREVTGIDHIIIGHDHPGVPQKKTLENLEMFATKVMPYFRDLEEKQADAVAAS